MNVPPQNRSNSTDASPIRTAVVGFGLAGRVFHAPFVHAVSGLTLTAIVQRTGEEAARQYPQATILRSFDDVLRSDVELVVIATPNASHVPLAREALGAGKHVVIDKPLAPTAAEAEELDALARRMGVLLVPFHNRRFDGDFLTLQALLREEAVGRPVLLRSRFDRFRPAVRAGTWKEAAGLQNGLLMDLGPHLVDQALVLFGRPLMLQASVRTDRTDGTIEDAFDLTLMFLHGSRALRVEVGSSMLAAVSEPRFRLLGTAGAFMKHGLDPQEPTLVAGGTVPAEGSAQDWLSESELAWGTLTTGTGNSPLQTHAVPTLPGDYRRFYAAVADALQRGSAPPATGRDAIRVARLLELARESSRTGTALPIPEKDW